jgi:hypothetical protein
VEQLADAVQDRRGGSGPADRDADGSRQQLVEEDDRDEAGQEDPDAEEEPPRPRAPAVDDVLFAQARVLGAEEARPGDQPADEQVDEAAEPDDRAEGRGERPPDAEADLVVEPEEGGRARQQCDAGRDARQAAQLRRERDSSLDFSLPATSALATVGV